MALSRRPLVYMLLSKMWELGFCDDGRRAWDDRCPRRLRPDRASCDRLQACAPCFSFSQRACHDSTEVLVCWMRLSAARSWRVALAQLQAVSSSVVSCKGLISTSIPSSCKHFAKQSHTLDLARFQSHRGCTPSKARVCASWRRYETLT